MLKCKFHNFIKNLTSDEGGLVQHGAYKSNSGLSDKTKVQA